MKEIDRAKPIRKGEFYGSPACCNARLCKYADFVQATKDADAMVEQLGPAWEPNVFENLGWHAFARLKHASERYISVSADRRGRGGRITSTVRYSVLVNLPGGGSVSASGRDVRKAMRAAIDQIKRGAEARIGLAETFRMSLNQAAEKQSEGDAASVPNRADKACAREAKQGLNLGSNLGSDYLSF
jgi:hypothetical protein